MLRIVLLGRMGRAGEARRALASLTVSWELILEAKESSELGSLSRVVYESDEVDSPETAIAGIPSLDASHAAPLEACSSFSLSESMRVCGDTYTVPEFCVTVPRLSDEESG